MIEVVSVKFKGRGKVYYFDPAGVEVQPGQQVVVSTSKGEELCDCVQGTHTVTDERIVPPLRPVLRVATEEDLKIAAQHKAREKEAMAICERCIAEHGLEMKLVDVEYAFDGSKILFFFTADGRVDFRALVRDLAGIFRTRIELRQVGVRDEAKMLGGIGMCGRPYCCSQFLDDFQPVSTKMAKTQNLSLNPAKISGCCGRLMCCLRYEEEAYEDLVRRSPKIGTFVETVAGYGNVVQVNLLRQTVKVRIDGDNDTMKTCPVDEIAAIPGGRPKEGEPLPHLLVLPEKPPEEPEEDDWLAPPVFAEDTMDERRLSAPSPAQEPRQKPENSHRNKNAKAGKRPQTQEKPGKSETAPAGSGKRKGKPGGEKKAAQKPSGPAGGEKRPAPKPAADPSTAAPTEKQAEKSGEKKKAGGYRKPYRGKYRPKNSDGGKPKPNGGGGGAGA